MIPESRLIRSEVTLRDMALPEETRLTRKALVRWIALSLGLMAPNETRQQMLEVLEALFYFHVQRQQPTTRQILEKVGEIATVQPHPKTVYYHLLNLKNAGLIGRKKGRYYFSEEEGRGLGAIIKGTYEQKLQQTFQTLGEALTALENNFKATS